MQYFIAFLEGFITFISPCLLPMLPVYISYFAGGESTRVSRTVKNALGFVAGFTMVFVLMGVTAGVAGALLARYRIAVNVITGAMVILFGLHYLGILTLPFLRGRAGEVDTRNLGFFSSVLFGIVFSVSWTPCVGVFLGSALMLASHDGSVLAGTLMLLLYSLGLGIPFLVCAVMIDRLKAVFGWIKRHYRIINIVCGVILIVVGLLMMTGLLNRWISLLA